MTYTTVYPPQLVTFVAVFGTLKAYIVAVFGALKAYIIGMLNLLNKWNAPRLVKVWYAMIKYSIVFLVWSYGLAYIMPPLWAGFIGFWIALSLIITVHDDTWLRLLQPKVIWVQPPEHRAPSSLAKEFESHQKDL